MKIKAGKNKQYEIEIFVEKIPKNWENVSYNEYLLKGRFLGEEFPIIVEKKKENWGLKLTIPVRKKFEKLIGRKIPADSAYLTFDEETAKELLKLKEELKKKSEEEKKRAFSYPTRLVAKRETFFLGDMDQERVVFRWNKPDEMVEEHLKERFEELKKKLSLLGKTLTLSWGEEVEVPDEIPEGTELSIQEVEKLFEKDLKELEERKKKSDRETEKLRKEAIRKAKETGEKVYIRKVYVFDGDNPTKEDELLLGEHLQKLYNKYGKEELGMVEVWEVATPKGEITIELIPTH